MGWIVIMWGNYSTNHKMGIKQNAYLIGKTLNSFK